MTFTPGRRFACPGLPSHTPNGVLYGRRHSDSWFLTSCASLRPSDLRSTQGERNEDFVLVEQSPGGGARRVGETRSPQAAACCHQAIKPEQDNGADDRRK